MSTIAPSTKTYALIRAGFVAQGISLNKFCQAHGLGRQNARKACLGLWKGPQGQKVLAFLYAASQGLAGNEFPAKSPDGRGFFSPKKLVTD